MFGLFELKYRLGGGGGNPILVGGFERKSSGRLWLSQAEQLPSKNVCIAASSKVILSCFFKKPYL